jgi:kynurenine formamidase
MTVTPVLANDTKESTDPAPERDDLLITRAALETASGALTFPAFNALVIRTTPNDETKRSRNYDRQPAAFFSADAMRWIVARGVEHLVTDLPSLDRANDQGRLTAHRLFWNLGPGASALADDTRAHATVTELAFIPNAIPDGAYLLNIQIAPFAADAAPSRPILMPLRAA